MHYMMFCHFKTCANLFLPLVATSLVLQGCNFKNGTMLVYEWGYFRAILCLLITAMILSEL